MGLEFTYDEGQTPLSEEAKKGLLIKTITTNGELNEFEQQNINKAILWTVGKNISVEQLLSETFILLLHKKMYEDVWAWAGKFRGVETNLGVSPHLIGIELRQFLGDALCWIQKEVYQPKEIAIRIKHRIVSIHCFPNGNGRHSRLFADLIMEKIYGKKYFSWGAADLVRAGNLRKKYIAALKEADNGQIDSLLKFALS